MDDHLGADEAAIAARTSASAALLALAIIAVGPLVIVRGTILDLMKDR